MILNLPKYNTLVISTRYRVCNNNQPLSLNVKTDSTITSFVVHFADVMNWDEHIRVFRNKIAKNLDLYLLQQFK